MKYESHPLICVIPCKGLDMICYFRNGEVKKFNFKQVVERFPEFKALENDDVFFNAYVDLGGLCVTFNETLDISEETLYQRGETYNIKKENKKIIKQLYSYCKELRKESKITQKELSILTKIPQSGIARIESGKNDIQLSTLANYLEPLGYTIQIVKR